MDFDDIDDRMDEWGEKLEKHFKEGVKKARQVRDELRLKAHLGTMEARDEWDDLEHKWEEMYQELNANEHVAKGKAKVEKLAGEIKAGYGRLMATIRDGADE